MTIIEQQKDLKTILKKHVNTIHCSNNLTLVQRKLFNALLFNAYHEISEKLQYMIPVKKLCTLIGYDSRDYKKLRKSILDLITTAIEWNVIENDKGDQQEKWRASAVVSAAKIENGICTYEFSSVMRELLYRPEIYGKIDINIMTSFNSSYGLALYENCIRFQGIATTPWLPISTFRKLMGIAENRYKNFCDLKKRVLDIAVKEVNLYSPIKVIPEIQRVNKKVTNIKFKLSLKEKMNHNNIIIENTDSELINILKRDFSLSEKAVSDVLSQYELEFIENKIQLIKISESFRSGKIRDIAAYLMDALKRDYKPSRSSKNVLKEMKYKDEMHITANKANEEAQIRKLKRQKKQKIDNYLNSLGDYEKKKLHAVFEKDLMNSKDGYSIKSYRTYGMKSRIVQALFNCYVIDIIDKLVVEASNQDVCVLDLRDSGV